MQESVFTRATTLENWWSRQASRNMFEPEGDSSKSPVLDDGDLEEFSPICGAESPPHLQAKKDFWARKARQSGDEEALPAVGVSASSSAHFDVRKFLDDEEKEIQEIIASSVPYFSEKQRRYKFGGCPRHLSLSLQPHVPKSGPQRGHLLLRCSNFWKRGSDDRPLCWFQYPFPMKLWSHLPKPIQEQFVDLENSLQRNAMKS